MSFNESFVVIDVESSIARTSGVSYLVPQNNGDNEWQSHCGWKAATEGYIKSRLLFRPDTSPKKKKIGCKTGFKLFLIPKRRQVILGWARLRAWLRVGRACLLGSSTLYTWLCWGYTTTPSLWTELSQAQQLPSHVELFKMVSPDWSPCLQLEAKI